MSGDAADEFISLPSLETILATFRMIDQWLADEEAQLKARYPQGGPLLDLALTKLQTAQAMVAELQKLSEAVAVLKTGETPTSPDDVDL